MAQHVIAAVASASADLVIWTGLSLAWHSWRAWRR